MLTVVFITPIPSGVDNTEMPASGVHSVKVISRGQKGKDSAHAKTAQVVVTPKGGGQPYTRHLVQNFAGKYADDSGVLYSLS